MSLALLHGSTTMRAITTPEAGAIEVWLIRLDVGADAAAPLAAVLDEDERARMQRLHGELLQTRFVVAHAAARGILGQYLGVLPQDVIFGSVAAGKPVVRGQVLAFNLSHSGDVAVCAVAANGNLGVDVEAVRPVPDADTLASRFFSGEEAAELALVPAGDRLRAFFDVWTRKEAFLKATGEGMARPLDSFSVSVAQNPPRLMRGGAGWLLRMFEPCPGYVGALAYDQPITSVRCRWWIG